VYDDVQTDPMKTLNMSVTLNTAIVGSIMAARRAADITADAVRADTSIAAGESRQP
jgi:hypothetical protein